AEAAALRVARCGHGVTVRGEEPTSRPPRSLRGAATLVRGSGRVHAEALTDRGVRALCDRGWCAAVPLGTRGGIGGDGALPRRAEQGLAPVERGSHARRSGATGAEGVLRRAGSACERPE